MHRVANYQVFNELFISISTQSKCYSIDKRLFNWLDIMRHLILKRRREQMEGGAAGGNIRCTYGLIENTGGSTQVTTGLWQGSAIIKLHTRSYKGRPSQKSSHCASGIRNECGCQKHQEKTRKTKIKLSIRAFEAAAGNIVDSVELL